MPDISKHFDGLGPSSSLAQDQERALCKMRRLSTG
jgi:hypothetical protein